MMNQGVSEPYASHAKMYGRGQNFSEEEWDAVREAAYDLDGMPSSYILKALALPTTRHSVPQLEDHQYPTFFCAWGATICKNLAKIVLIFRRPGDGELIPLVILLDETTLWAKAVAMLFNGKYMIVGHMWNQDPKRDLSQVESNFTRLNPTSSFLII